MVAGLAALGASVKEGSIAASSLVGVVLALQVCVSAWISCCCPSSDRFDGLVHAISWGAESCSTALRLIAAKSREVPHDKTSPIEAIALALAVTAIAVPVAKHAAG